MRIAQAAETARAETKHLRGESTRHLLSRGQPPAAATNQDHFVHWIRHVIVAMIMVMTQPSVGSRTTRVCSARQRAISLKRVGRRKEIT